MKHIYVNLKRFDVLASLGGVNHLAPMEGWAQAIVRGSEEGLRGYAADEAEFVIYFPEAHMLPAMQARSAASPLRIGCQGVHREDVTAGGNFGAFTTLRPAAAMQAMGCQSVLVGHCEERRDKAGILAEAGCVDTGAVNRMLNKEIRCAQAQGMDVLYCIGENSDEQDRWEQVLGQQLAIGLEGVDAANVVIGYEPIWSIGPGKTPAGRDYIQKIAAFVKERTRDITGKALDVVYGGGLKVDNAAMLASIPEIDGGLIALTRFQGDIGFYPEEYLEIVRIYMASHAKSQQGDKNHEA